MKKILLIILIISLILIAGCLSREKVKEININTNVKTCDDVSLKASIVNINEEKRWVSVKISNTGNSDIDSIIINILSDEKLRATINRPLAIGETKVETTNYGNLDSDNIGAEIIPLIKFQDKLISCGTKGLILSKKFAK